MVRAPASRVRKYDAKMVGDVVKSRIDAQRDFMVEQQEAIQGELSLMEAKAKAILENLGVSTIFIPHYLNFVRECYRLFKKFSQNTRANEAQTLFNKWVSRGLNGSYLEKVAELCGIHITVYS